MNRLISFTFCSIGCLIGCNGDNAIPAVEHTVEKVDQSLPSKSEKLTQVTLTSIQRKCGGAQLDKNNDHQDTSCHDEQVSQKLLIYTEEGQQVAEVQTRLQGAVKIELLPNNYYALTETTPLSKAVKHSFLVQDSPVELEIKTEIEIPSNLNVLQDSLIME